MNIKKKLLILIVAYNHEKFIKNVLQRISIDLAKKYDVEILINDDSSSDKTVKYVQDFIEFNSNNSFKYKVLSNPENQGYGGNQKIGYHYAIKHNFDFVALLHGDGQFAPEYLEKLIDPLGQNNIDAVFGSRMLGGEFFKGGMPRWKFYANIILTAFANMILGIYLTEFHTGFRAYSKHYLESINFNENSNNFVFDTEIIIQGIHKKMKFHEIPIDTRYFEEASQINFFNSVRYGLGILKRLFIYKLFSAGIIKHPLFK